MHYPHDDTHTHTHTHTHTYIYIYWVKSLDRPYTIYYDMHDLIIMYLISILHS
jgi:hypothetical protein